MRQADASLAEELPYWDFLEEPFAHAVLSDGSLVAGCKVKLVDSECHDETDANHLTLALRAALNSVAEGTTLQFVLGVRSDFSDMLDRHVAGKSHDVHPLVRRIGQLRVADIRSDMEAGELYRPELFVFVRVPATNGSARGLFKRPEQFSQEATTAYGETLDALAQNLESLRSGFATAGLQSQPLSKRQMLQRVYGFLNPKRAASEPVPEVRARDEADLPKEILENAEWLAAQSPREQLVFGDLTLGLEQFTLDGFFHRVVTLKTLPEVTHAGQLGDFLRMPFHYDLLLSIEVPQQASEMAKLQQKRKMAHSMAITHGGRASDLESETKLNSTEELIRELLSTGQRVYACQLSVILRAPATEDGRKALSRQVRDVLARFRALQGAEGLEEGVAAWKIVKGNLPAAPLSLERARKMKTNNLADFLPVYGPREGDADPVAIFRNRLNGLVSFDSFSSELSNFSSLVTGSSGSGKSFLNNCILMEEISRGTRVFIIDIGGSYKKLTEAVGGQYLEVGLSESYRLNPFDVPDPTKEPCARKLKSLLTVIESMVAEDETAGISKLDRALLERAITDLYASKRALGRVPVLSDLATELAKFEEPSMKAMAKMLYLWTGDRPYGRLLDGPGGLSSNAPICCFDLKNLSIMPDLQSVMLLILTDFILSEVSNETTRRVRIVIDEGWALLKSPSSANFIEFCVRTLRKMAGGGGITFITQGVGDVVGSSVGAAILNNTATKFVLSQRGDSETLRSVLKINSNEEALTQSLTQRKGEFSECFLIQGDHRQVVRIHPTPIEYWLSTSDARDNQYLAGLQAEGLSLVDAIEKAAHDRPRGVATQEEGAA